MKDIIEKINYYADISKKRNLTKKEELERQKLRKKYLDNFKKNFLNEISNLKIIDENNNDITPQKIKNIKNKKLN